MARKKKVSNPIDSESEIVQLSVDTIPDEECLEIIGKQPYTLTMYLDQDVEGTYLEKFIHAVEKQVRCNDDYKMYLTALRESEAISRDAFLHNITSSDAEIQLHHYPLTMYAICKSITLRMLENKERVSSFYVSNEVIKQHFRNHIGLVPLTVTMHQLAHLGKLKFLRTQVFGSWEKFFEEYQDYLSDYDYTVVKELSERTSIKREESLAYLIENSPTDIESDEE